MEYNTIHMFFEIIYYITIEKSQVEHIRMLESKSSKSPETSLISRFARNNPVKISDRR